MDKFIKPLMGLISGVSLMLVFSFSMPIIDNIAAKLYSNGFSSFGILITGIISDALLAVSLLGVIITVVFSFNILRLVLRKKSENSDDKNKRNI